MSTRFTTMELELFIAHTCSHCFQPNEAETRIRGLDHGCPHLRRAIDRDQQPGAWERRRNGPLGETFKCADFTAKTPSTRRGTADDATEAMFDPEPGEKFLVPVDGWPDYRGRDRKTGAGEHQ